MQSHDWNDLRYFLALFRSRKLKDAAVVVGTSETTVSRRIKAFEEKLGTALFRLSGVGRYEPTDAATKILPHAEIVELENTALREELGNIENSVTGTVRVSSVPVLVNRFLVPNLKILTNKYPSLSVELIPETRNLDLTRREADIAVRFARPSTGGLSVKAKKLAELSFGVYGPEAADIEAKQWGWIRYDDDHASLPQAKWLEGICKNPANHASTLRIADAETALEAVANGLGKTLLPCIVAEADPRLCSQKIDVDANNKLPARDLWLLSHVDQSARKSVNVVKEWLTELPWSIGRT